MFYYQDGTRSIGLEDWKKDDFYIEEYNGKYSFRGKEIFNHLHIHCEHLGEAFQERLFNGEDYEGQLHQIPPFVYQGGLSSQFQLTKEQFELDFNRMSMGCQQQGISLAKHLYLADLKALIGSLQNNLQIIEGQIPNFYRELSKINGGIVEATETVYCSGGETTVVLAILNSIIITFCSILDLLSKLAYESEHFILRFGYRMEKLKANKVTFNDVRLKRLAREDTVFDYDYKIKEIVSLRNEIVHNNCWEYEPKIYVKLVKGEVEERYIYMPDGQDGKLIVSKNRKRFFAQQRKINEELPDLTFHFLEKVKGTLEQLIQYSSKKQQNQYLSFCKK